MTALDSQTADRTTRLGEAMGAGHACKLQASDTPTMPYDRGDVVLVWFPHSDLKTMKRRPAIVVQGDALGTGLPQVVVAMITSNLARLGTRVVSQCYELHQPAPHQA